LLLVLLLRLGGYLMNGWMWRPAEAEAINREAPRAKGGREPGPKWAGPIGPGRPAQADRPRPISARFGPVFLPGCFSRDLFFVCTCMWAFDVISFTVKA
jgi:hypothetical protein